MEKTSPRSFLLDLNMLELREVESKSLFYLKIAWD